MAYNSPDTVYHKQARSLKAVAAKMVELAKQGVTDFRFVQILACIADQAYNVALSCYGFCFCVLRKLSSLFCSSPHLVLADLLSSSAKPLSHLFFALERRVEGQSQDAQATMLHAQIVITMTCFLLF